LFCDALRDFGRINRIVSLGRPLLMNETEWTSGKSLTAMLIYVTVFAKSSISPRKKRLLACASCRLVGHFLVDPRSRRAIAVSERFADGLVTPTELQAAVTGAERAHRALLSRDDPWKNRSERTPAQMVAFAVSFVCKGVGYIPIISMSLLSIARILTGEADKRLHSEAMVAMLQDICGNPFRPAVVDRAWQTREVLDLARVIYDGDHWDRLPQLADALEQAGCFDEALLSHLRNRAEHFRGCWAVDLLLNKN